MPTDVPNDAPPAFFSYCRADSDFALKLAEDLKSAGANVWIDQLDIEPGTPWDGAVEDALRNAPRMLVILSTVSVASANVRDEIAYALDRQKRIIPVLLSDCEIPIRLSRAYNTSIFAPTTAAAFACFFAPSAWLLSHPRQIQPSELLKRRKSTASGKPQKNEPSNCRQSGSVRLRPSRHGEPKQNGGP